MNIAKWGDPIKCACGERDSIIHGFYVNDVHIGSVVNFSGTDEGPFFGMSQIRRFGMSPTLAAAKEVVEVFALYDAVIYPTRGSA